jgi:hypothetical protein
MGSNNQLAAGVMKMAAASVWHGENGGNGNGISWPAKWQWRKWRISMAIIIWQYQAVCNNKLCRLMAMAVSPSL